MPQELSIIVTLRSNLEEFEATLVSVLEHRPEDCQVIVAHDGSYNDPFGIGEEVDFAVAEDDSLIELLRAGISHAAAPITHILCDGISVTEEWTFDAEDQFDDAAVGCVSPLIMDQANPAKILGAGWSRDAAKLRRAISRGATAVGRLEMDRIHGTFVAASFWRTDLLRAAIEIESVESSTDADFVWSQLAHKAGFEHRIALDSKVFADASHEELQLTGFQPSFDSQIASKMIKPQGVVSVAISAMQNVLSAPLSPSSYAGAIGRVTAALLGSPKANDLKQELQAAVEAFCSPECSTLKMPEQTSEMPLRRAA